MGKADGGVVFERVTKRYGNVTAVDDVSFEVAQGELVTLLDLPVAARRHVRRWRARGGTGGHV